MAAAGQRLYDFTVVFNSPTTDPFDPSLNLQNNSTLPIGPVGQFEAHPNRPEELKSSPKLTRFFYNGSALPPLVFINI